jgi:hypothetical protein
MECYFGNLVALMHSTTHLTALSPQLILLLYLLRALLLQQIRQEVAEAEDLVAEADLAAVEAAEAVHFEKLKASPTTQKLKASPTTHAN